MSAVLLLTAGTGPAEGLLLQDLRDSGHVVDVLDVASHAWLRRRPGLAPAPLYPWTGTHALRAAGAAVAHVGGGEALAVQLQVIARGDVA